MLRKSLVALFKTLIYLFYENSAVGGFMLQMQNIVDNSITFNEVYKNKLQPSPFNRPSLPFNVQELFSELLQADSLKDNCLKTMIFAPGLNAYFQPNVFFRTCIHHCSETLRYSRMSTQVTKETVSYLANKISKSVFQTNAILD